MADNIQYKLLNELILCQTWLFNLNSFESKKVTSGMKDHAISLLGCSKDDVDRVMLSQIDPLPTNDKDWKIFSVCLEYLHHARTGTL
jgi:hypothetical protein